LSVVQTAPSGASRWISDRLDLPPEKAEIFALQQTEHAEKAESD
jgi:hypothetical protein